MSLKIDRTNRKILQILQQQGRLTNQEVAERVGISSAACWRRIRSMEEDGIVSRYAALLDRRAVDLKFCAYVHISLARHESDSVENFEKFIVQQVEVLECHSTTGDADYLLKVVARDIEHYEKFLKETLFKLSGILQVRSNISLREVKSDTRLPLNES